MLWVIRYKWPSRAWFTFNCYRYFAVLIIQSQDGKNMAFTYSYNGVTQGDALAMVAYRMELLLLIRRLKEDFLMVRKP
jgi:hypothetical protein